MPTYSYRCEECHHEFERVQRISEDPIRECPACHQPRVRRQITSGNFILKGGGWYSDLYAGKSNKKPDKTTTTSNGSSTNGSSESRSSESTSSTSSSSTTSAAK